MATTADFDPKLVDGKYRLTKPLGAGSFGRVYSAIHIETGKEVAVKLEKDNGSFHQHLLYEAQLYELALKRGLGIPDVWWCGKHGGQTALVMELLGPSLKDLQDFCGGQFSLKTVLMLVDQMVARVEFVHSRNLIHQDIKPSNFLMGSGKNGKLVYLIDFGLAKAYRDQRLQHVPFAVSRGMKGTAAYASFNTHIGYEQSRRDDMTALGYTLVHMLRGSLPWSEVKAATTRQLWEKVCEMKVVFRDRLCQGLPEEFNRYFKYVEELRYEEVPDYNFIRQLFGRLGSLMDVKYDFEFDWDHIKQRPSANGRRKASNPASTPLTSACKPQPDRKPRPESWTSEK